MNAARMEEIQEDLFEQIREIRRTKGKEYATDEDTLADFFEVAEDAGTSPLQTWLTYVAKHQRAVATFVREGSTKSESIEGRILDVIVYHILLLGLIEDVEARADPIAEEVGRFFKENVFSGDPADIKGGAVIYETPKITDIGPAPSPLEVAATEAVLKAIGTDRPVLLTSDAQGRLDVTPYDPPSGGSDDYRGRATVSMVPDVEKPREGVPTALEIVDRYRGRAVSDGSSRSAVMDQLKAELEENGYGGGVSLVHQTFGWAIKYTPGTGEVVVDES